MCGERCGKVWGEVRGDVGRGAVEDAVAGSRTEPEKTAFFR